MAGLLDMLGGAQGMTSPLLRLLAGAPGAQPLYGAPLGPTQQPIGLDTASAVAPSRPTPLTAPAAI